MKFFVIIQILILSFLPHQTSTKKWVYELESVKLLAKLINSEAHAESFIDKLRVGSVVLNRMKHIEFPKNLNSVIFDEGQFDGVNYPLFSLLNPVDETYESIIAAKYLLEHGSILPADVVYFLNPKQTKNKRWLRKLIPKIYFKSKNIWYFKN